MQTESTTISKYQLTTIRGGPGRLEESDYRVRLVGPPQVGRPMVMYGGDGNRRIVTSPIVRMFGSAADSGTYVQTRNTLYLLEEPATAH